MKGNGHPTNNQNISEYVALLYQKYSHKLYCNAFHYTSNPMDEYKNSHYPLDYDDGNDISRNLIDPEDLFIRYIYLDSLKIIFSTLTPDFRDTIIFHYFYGFKYSEIACMFHISERAVKKRIAVAKKRVRTMFQKEDFL